MAVFPGFFDGISEEWNRHNAGGRQEARPPSDLQEAEEVRRDAEAAATVHSMIAGWYPDAQDENVRHYFDGRDFIATERWDGAAWQEVETSP